jgi:hypothetical protein
MNAYKPRTHNKYLRDVIMKEWGVYDTFSDPCSHEGKPVRRIKFMRNGWSVPVKMKTQIKADVRSYLAEQGVTLLECGWSVGFTWRGDYDYFYIRVMTA